jgi:hypothetical protein
MITVHGLNKLGFTNIDDFNLQDDGDGVYIKKWNSDQPQPSEADITTAHDAWQAEYDAQEYARNRQAEYPSLLELTVALYDTDDKSAVEAKRASVKLKYPKPE